LLNKRKAVVADSRIGDTTLPDRNWNTNGILPDSSPELDNLLAECKTPEEIREVCLKYAEEKGLISRTSDGLHARLTGKSDPEAHQFSRIVTLPSGRRTMITGARSEAELNAAEEALKKSQL
jgi:hypothetical protein